MKIEHVFPSDYSKEFIPGIGVQGQELHERLEESRRINEEQKRQAKVLVRSQFRPCRLRDWIPFGIRQWPGNLETVAHALPSGTSK